MQQVQGNYTPPAPITAPIMAPLGGDPQGQPISSGAPQGMVQAAYSGMQQQQPFSPPPMNPAMPKTSMEGAPGAPTGDVIQVDDHSADERIFCSSASQILAGANSLCVYSHSHYCQKPINAGCTRILFSTQICLTSKRNMYVNLSDP